jgi:hypothetical protein
MSVGCLIDVPDGHPIEDPPTEAHDRILSLGSIDRLAQGMSTNHTLAELNGISDSRPDETDSPRGSDTTDFQPVTLAPFLNKLHEILSKGEPADSIRWGEG